MSLARSLASALLVLTFVGVPTAGHAEPPGSEACEPSQGALTFLGCSLAQKLTPSASGASVTIIALKTDRELPTEGALRERVQSAVAIALKSPTKPGERSKLRVELSVEKVGGVLRVTAELRRATTLWQRLRHAKPSAEQRAFVEVALDAELRSLIPPPPLVVSDTLKLKAPERGIVALACGALGSDGAQEIALVTRSSVRVGRIVGGAFAERKRATWASLSSIAPAPLREPIGSADLTQTGALRVGISDRKDGLELTSELAVAKRFDALLPIAGGGCAAREGLGLSSRAGACDVAARASGASVDAVAGHGALQLGRSLGTAQLVSLRSDAGAAPALRVGAQLAIGDADSDGDAEVAYSADTLEPKKDKLSVTTWRAGKLIPRFELAAPDIHAIAICSHREGPAMAPIVVATGDELWLIR